MIKTISFFLAVVVFLTFTRCTFAQQANLNYLITDNASWQQGQTVAATSVTESYSYTNTTDTLTITYQFNATGFAPLPPILALAYKYGLPMTINPTPQDTGKTSVLGPLIGVNNTNSYTVQITGLSRYVNAQRVFGNNLIPAKLTQTIESEINKVIQAGHLRPALFLSNTPGCTSYSDGCPDRGIVEWYAPSDTLYYLSEAYPLLSNATQTSLKNYLQSERTTYKPETLKSLSFINGTSRFAFDKDDGLLQNNGSYSWYNGYTKFRTSGNPKVYALYGLDRYYELMGLTPSSSDLINFTTIVNNELNNRDWATMYWTANHSPEYNAVHAVNQLFAGFIGYTRLAKLAGDQTAQNFGWGMVAKMAILRYAMGKYTQFEWDRGIRPAGFSSSDPLWNAKFRAQDVDNWESWNHLNWRAELITFNWPGTLTSSDPYYNLPHVNAGIYNTKQIHLLNDASVDTWDYYGWTEYAVDSNNNALPADGQLKSPDNVTYGPYLLPFADMVPEVGRFMKDYLKPEAKMYVNRVVENQPNWYMAYSEAIVGQEIGYSMPQDSYGQFLANAWILDTNPDLLYRYSDNSWTKLGDYFYINKLTETALAYKGVSWSDQSGPSLTPSCPIGDVTGDCHVTIQDFISVLTNFGSSNSTYDLNKDNKVNALDLEIVINSWGQ